jgi:hypothetical protein
MTRRIVTSVTLGVVVVLAFLIGRSSLVSQSRTIPLSNEQPTVLTSAAPPPAPQLTISPTPAPTPTTESGASQVITVLTQLAGSAPTTTPEVLSFHAFAGPWWHHGFGLTINDLGFGEATWRTYRWCSDFPPPCDRMDGNMIRSGGVAHLVLPRIDGPSAQGMIEQSNDDTFIQTNSRVTLTLLPYDVARLDTGPSSLFVCGPKFADLAPRNVLTSSPCGA